MFLILLFNNEYTKALISLTRYVSSALTTQLGNLCRFCLSPTKIFNFEVTNYLTKIVPNQLGTSFFSYKKQRFYLITSSLISVSSISSINFLSSSSDNILLSLVFSYKSQIFLFFSTSSKISRTLIYLARSPTNLTFSVYSTNFHRLDFSSFPLLRF